jgi:hypothetical protein
MSGRGVRNSEFIEEANIYTVSSVVAGSSPGANSCEQFHFTRGEQVVRIALYVLGNSHCL